MKTAFLLTLFFHSIVSFSQKDPKSVEIELKKQFEKIYYWLQNPKLDDTINSYDSMQKANDYIMDQILQQGKNNPAFFSYPFDSLNEYLDIVTCKDKSFRIYSWDTYTGGTGHIFYAVAQYIGHDKKTHTEYLTDTANGDFGLWYSEIYTLEDKGEKYYFCIGNGKYSTRDLAQEVRVYTVKGNLLVQAPIIKTPKGLTNHIHVAYDLSNLGRAAKHSIFLDQDRKELNIPIVDENGKLSTKNIIYKYTGEHFERIDIR